MRKRRARRRWGRSSTTQGGAFAGRNRAHDVDKATASVVPLWLAIRSKRGTAELVEQEPLIQACTTWIAAAAHGDEGRRD